MVMSRLRRRNPVRSARLQKMSTSDLVEWFDVDLMGLGGAFDQYRFHKGPPGEVTLRLEQLFKVWEEIAAREVARENHRG